MDSLSARICSSPSLILSEISLESAHRSGQFKVTFFYLASNSRRNEIVMPFPVRGQKFDLQPLMIGLDYHEKEKKNGERDNMTVARP